MKPTARLAGSWWTQLSREQATSACLAHLARFQTSEYSLRTTNRCDSTGLFPPAKRRYQGRPAPLYVPDSDRDAGEAA